MSTFTSVRLRVLGPPVGGCSWKTHQAEVWRCVFVLEKSAGRQNRCVEMTLHSNGWPLELSTESPRVSDWLRWSSHNKTTQYGHASRNEQIGLAGAPSLQTDSRRYVYPYEIVLYLPNAFTTDPIMTAASRSQLPTVVFLPRFSEDDGS